MGRFQPNLRRKSNSPHYGYSNCFFPDKEYDRQTVLFTLIVDCYPCLKHLRLSKITIKKGFPALIMQAIAFFQKKKIKQKIWLLAKVLISINRRGNTAHTICFLTAYGHGECNSLPLSLLAGMWWLITGSWDRCVSALLPFTLYMWQLMYRKMSSRVIFLFDLHIMTHLPNGQLWLKIVDVIKSIRDLMLMPFFRWLAFTESLNVSLNNPDSTLVCTLIQPAMTHPRISFFTSYRACGHNPTAVWWIPAFHSQM